MAEDYYGGEEDMPPKDMDSKSVDEPKEDTEEQTSLLPKSMFGGKEPQADEEYMFKVVHIYDDEVEVAYATGKPKDGKKSVSGADDMMDKMASENMGGGE